MGWGIALFGILIITLITALLIIKNLYNKIIIYQKEVEQSNNYIQFILAMVKDTIEQMRYLDSKELFEKDDQVGVLWVKITQIIEKMQMPQR